MTISKLVLGASRFVISLCLLVGFSNSWALETPSAPPTPSPTPTPSYIAPVVTCEVVSTSTLDNPGDYGLKDKDGNPLPAGIPVNYPDLVLFRAYCFVANANDPLVVDTVPAMNALEYIKFPACDTTQQVCTAYQSVTANKVLTANRTLIAEVLVQNKSSQNYVIKPADLIGRTEKQTDAEPKNSFTTVKWSPLETPIYPPVKDAKCRVIVSGAVDPIPEDVENPEVRVSNGKLLFAASVTGLVGVGGEVKTIKWTGGPDENGLWTNPPLNVSSQVNAEVEIVSGQKISCGIRVKPSGQNYTIGLSRFGDCQFFGSTRSYYFLDPSNTKFQANGYVPPIQLLGLPIKYGETAPDVPFRGVVNGAASLEGVINVGTNGDVMVPPVEYRKFSGAVIVARSFDPQTNKVSPNPVAWGLLDYSNYSVTQMALLENVSEEETVVFQVYLAASQITDGQDLRGSTDASAIPLYTFVPGTQDNKPFDRLVPFVNASCGVMTIPVPARADKEVSPELQAVKMCTFSKSYQLKDLKSGRVTLDLMHITPEHGTHTYPPNLLKTAAAPVQCNPNESTKRSCWNISATNLGVSAQENPFESHESCREVKTVTTTKKVCDGYGCRNVQANTTQVVFRPGCKVLEANECGPGMAIRFSGYNQMMLSALGCAAKYDRPGDKVVASLVGHGILPYTSFGGSAPKHYTEYPKAYGANNGYACIPCRFGSDATKAGADLEADTAVLPVDQDSTTPRKPVYSFTKSTAAASCVKDVTFEVRYFGSSACDGVNAPPGHFCNASNIAIQNCPTKDTAMTASNPFSGGGNIAGKFRIPVCPGSGIQYDSVSVSWSPVILDVTGNGITVSRNFDLAQSFDIRGDGKARMLDWPMNNDEVAFLVRPNKGQVTSIKELFGDYKAKNGFEALRKLDSNKDGVINRKDKAFGELALWFDRNRNAKADPGEIEPLDVHGVYELPLTYAKPSRKGVEGRTLSGVYFNQKHQRYMNIEDHYFYEYITKGQKLSRK